MPEPVARVSSAAAGERMTSGERWTNYPETIDVTPRMTRRPQSLDELVAAIREAEAAGLRVHASGSRWSFSDCAVTEDCVIDTTSLDRPLQTVHKALVDGGGELLFHVEAGITIRRLYETLEGLGLALETMGGASGQTLAGAASTGTHGGDKFLPPLADSILALHLVGPSGRQFWVEPSAPLTDPGRLRALVAAGVAPQDVIHDDEIFDACLVALGCFGVIYSVVLRVRGAYDLIETTSMSTWGSVQATASDLVADPGSRFLQVLLSPYRSPGEDHRCLVTTRHEADATRPAHRPVPILTAVVALDILTGLSPLGRLTLTAVLARDLNLPLGTEERIARMIAAVISASPADRRVIADRYDELMVAMWLPGTIRGLSHSVMDLGAGKPIPASQPGLSIELSFPGLAADGTMGCAGFLNDALAIIESATAMFLAGYIAIRFAGRTRACLGMQQWAPTASVEIAVSRGLPGSEELFAQLYGTGMRHGALPHWGQLLDLTQQRTATPLPRLRAWRRARAQLCGGQRTFDSELSSRWRLTTPEALPFLLALAE